MKHLLFTLLFLTGFAGLQAQQDSFFLDTFCFVHIGYEPMGSGIYLTAYAYDFSDPIFGDFDYSWSTGDTSASIPITAPGTYCVTATSANSNCVVSECIVVDDQNCEVFTWLDFSGYLYAYQSGIPPYTYTWSSGDTTAAIPTVDGDTYCVTVTDGFGCAADTCVTVTYNGLDSFCFADIFIWPDTAGNIVLTAYGIQGIFWPGIGTYQWSTGDTTQSIVVDSIAEYCVTVTSGICVSEACIDLNDTDCDIWLYQDPFGSLSAYGWGIPPYSYTWSTGETTATIPIVAGETYCVTMTDALGCSVDTCAVVDTIIRPPIDTFCFVYISYEAANTGVVLTAEVFPQWNTGYSYLWSTGETTASIIGSPGDNYCVTVTSPDGCVSDACIDLANLDCTDLFVLCDPDGTVGVFSSGVPPFTYLWSTGETTEFIQGEADSTYCVTITDALNCIADTCVTAMVAPPDTNSRSGIYGEIIGNDSTNFNDEYSGWVYLYRLDQNGTFELADSTEVLADFFLSGYFFEDVQPGEYLTKAVVSSVITGDDYVPTYHLSAIEWDEADAIVIEQTPAGGIWNIVHAPILLHGTTSLNGPGSVSGVIVDMDDLMANHNRDANGIQGVTLVLTDENDRSISYVITSDDGEFHFGNLPYGTYHLHADYLNVTGPFAVITIGPNNPDAVISFEVEGDDILLDNREIDLESVVNVFPNPAIDRVNIVYSDELVVSDVIISDVRGKVVKQLIDAPPAAQLEIPIEELSEGIYIIQLLTNRGMINKKIMVVE